jgi:hypothetical protein
MASKRLPKKAGYYSYSNYNNGTIEAFSLFPKLPDEIRKQIWHLVLAHEPSRLVPVWKKTWRRGAEGLPEDCPPSEQKYLNKVPPPAALHVCHELRILALAKYSLVFRGQNQRCPVYIDPEADVVLLAGKPNFAPLSHHALFHVKHLAVPLVDVRLWTVTRDNLDPAFHHLLGLLHRFRQLESLAFMLHDGGCRYCSERKFDMERESLSYKKYTGWIKRELDLPASAIRAVTRDNADWHIPARIDTCLLIRGGKPACGYGRED